MAINLIGCFKVQLQNKPDDLGLIALILLELMGQLSGISKLEMVCLKYIDFEGVSLRKFISWCGDRLKECQGFKSTVLIFILIIYGLYYICII